MTGPFSKDKMKSLKALRERAEAILHTQPDKTPTLATADVQALVLELSMHQIELELQNEELRQTQIELAEARDQYADLYDFAPFGYLTLTPDGTVVEANLTAAAKLGVERKRLLQSNLSEFLSREAADRFYLHRQRVFDSDSRQFCELEFGRDERARCIRFESVALDSESGRLCRSAMIDISDLKAARQRATDSEARLKTLNDSLTQRAAEQTREVRLLAEAVAHLGEGVLITRDRLDWPGPEIVFVNQAMCRICGYAADELIGQSPRLLQGDGTERETLKRIKAELAAGRSCRAELINYRKDGSSYPAELFITPLWDDAGRRTHFVSIYRDVTERKRAEEALRRSHERLEQRVRERTAELEQANQVCESANAIKSRFLAATSHDLRQPLQAVELYLSVLAQQFDRPQQREIYRKIRDSLNSMAELLDTLLDLSRFESGNCTPSRQDFRLQAVLDRIIANNWQQAKNKGLAIECGDVDCVLHSDPALLERILENFVTNAVRYTRQGSITIACSRGPDSAWISVSDTGIGIAPKDLDTIFEVYGQLDNPLRDRTKGFGLGLAIVKHVAELLEHRLQVRSVPDEGSTFAIEVPVAKASVEVVGLPVSGPAPETSRSGAVLLVDDDPVIIDAMTMLLEMKGFSVDSAADGEAALNRIADGIRPNVLVCDYRLPDGSGIEVIERIRKAIRTCLPAVLLTGDISIRKTETQNCANCTVLYKGVETEVLVSVLGKLLAKQ